MPNKLKIRASISRRFRVTKNGKVLFRGSHIRHLRRNKSNAGIRSQKVAHRLVGAREKKIKALLGV